VAALNLAVRFLTAAVTAAAGAAVAGAVFGLLGVLTGGPATALLIVGVLFGAAYGCLFGAYDAYGLLESGRGWRLLAVDLTWALPSTVAGAVLGNLIYPFFATLSYQESRRAGWLVYLAPASRTSGFGRDVLQTIGTVNIGGRGAHEHVHLQQARLLGPLYLPAVIVGYLGTGLVQFGWTGTVGLVLWLLRLRPRPWFVAPAASAVGGFWGWIYYQTPIERWAYGTERKPGHAAAAAVRPAAGAPA
jgi:hypothetical protein